MWLCLYWLCCHEIFRIQLCTNTHHSVVFLRTYPTVQSCWCYNAALVWLFWSLIILGTLRIILQQHWEYTVKLAFYIPSVQVSCQILNKVFEWLFGESVWGMQCANWDLSLLHEFLLTEKQWSGNKSVSAELWEIHLLMDVSKLNSATHSHSV